MVMDTRGTAIGCRRGLSSTHHPTQTLPARFGLNVGPFESPLEATPPLDPHSGLDPVPSLPKVVRTINRRRSASFEGVDGAGRGPGTTIQSWLNHVVVPPIEDGPNVDECTAEQPAMGVCANRRNGDLGGL